MEYQHGGDIYGTDTELLDFSVNTNPLGMPEQIKREVKTHEEDWMLYPDSKCRKVTENLRKMYEKRGIFLKAEDFICGNGASDLLYTLLFALRPKKALLFAPSFGEYEAALKAAGCETDWIFLEKEQNFSLIQAFDKAYEEKLREIKKGDYQILILGNPNNPTGMAITASELEKILSFCRERDILVVLDECFNWFLEDAGSYSAVSKLENDPNVFLLNAFTKIYAMAGLRFGYGICRNRDLMEKMQSCRQPWSVSGPAMRAALAVTEEQGQKELEAFQKETEKLVKEERNFLKKGLEELGFSVYPSMVNYLLFSDGEYLNKETIDYKKKCEEQGILIRSCKNFNGLDGSFYRITVKKHPDNERILAVLAQIKIQIKEEKAWQNRL